MRTHRWHAEWDGALIEVKYRAVPFSGADPLLGLYPTAEILIDGISVAQRAWEEHSSVRFGAAVQRADGAQLPISVFVAHRGDDLGCEIRVNDEVLDTL